MDLIVLIGLASAFFVVFLTLYCFQNKSNVKEHQDTPHQQRAQIREGIPRRAQIARNQRNRLRVNTATAAHDADSDNESDDEQERQTTHPTFTDEKMGAKKRAKLEAKEQKRIQREHELKLREEKKAKEAKLEEEQKKIQQKEDEIERKKEEAERLAREERERKEQEEYLKMKAAFSIEEEGFEEDDDEKENLLADFIQYIKTNKVVVLEDLASEFKLKTQQAIDRITELKASGVLTGVIDDRGKFIYISEEELKAVAKFIKQRGRVSITELAESSNKLINLSSS